MTDPAIRRAEPGDEVSIAAVVQAAYRHYVERIGRPPAPMLDDYHDLIARGVVRVAEIEGRIVGVLVLLPKADHFYIDNIATHPDVQGTGVGAAMLAHADREATEAGHDEIRLYTNVAMVENLAYYPRMGFVETGRGTEAGYERVYFSRFLSTDDSSG